MTPIVFLDIDGVLNSEECALARRHIRIDRHGVERHGDTLLGIDPQAVPHINRICDETGAVCVLSSTWRILTGLRDTLANLRRCGFTGKLVDKTPDLVMWPEGRGKDRGDEIQAWLDANDAGARPFVILDDSTDMAHLAHRLVRTSWVTGITAADADRAIAMLRGER